MRTLLLSSSLPVLLAVASLTPMPAHATPMDPEMSTGALEVALGPVLSNQAGPVLATPRPAPPAHEGVVPELSLDQLGQLIIQAIAGKSWGLLASLLLVGVVLVLRRAGARFLPWLGTERGVAVLAVIGGTSTLLALALSQGQPFSVGLLISCLVGALSASGLWSVTKSLVSPKPGAAPVCTPEEVANGACRPS